MHVSPDGSQIVAASIDVNQYDLWVLGNFLPSTK